MGFRLQRANAMRRLMCVSPPNANAACMLDFPLDLRPPTLGRSCRRRRVFLAFRSTTETAPSHKSDARPISNLGQDMRVWLTRVVHPWDDDDSREHKGPDQCLISLTIYPLFSSSGVDLYQALIRGLWILDPVKSGAVHNAVNRFLRHQELIDHQGHRAGKCSVWRKMTTPPCRRWLFFLAWLSSGGVDGDLRLLGCSSPGDSAAAGRVRRDSGERNHCSSCFEWRRHRSPLTNSSNNVKCHYKNQQMQHRIVHTHPSNA